MSQTTIPDYLKAGQGDCTIYLLHGGYGSKEYWAPMVRRLTQAGYRVIAWDAPGYGISALPADFSIDTAAQSLANLIDSTGTARNIIFGHSMGGLIAPRLAQLRPDAVTAVILSATVSSFGHLDAATRESFVAQRVAPLDAGKSMADVAAPLVRSMMGKDAAGPDVEEVILRTAATPDDTFRAAIRAIVDYDGAQALAELSKPTLVVAGEVDPIGIASELERLAAGMPDAEYHCIPGTGHYAWVEAPEVFDAVLMPFLARVAR